MVTLSQNPSQASERPISAITGRKVVSYSRAARSRPKDAIDLNKFRKMMFDVHKENRNENETDFDIMLTSTPQRSYFKVKKPLKESPQRRVDGK